MTRQVLGWVFGVALTAALVVVAVVGYRTDLPTGLRTSVQATTRPTAGEPPVTINAPCQALPAAIRSRAPVLAYVDDGALRELSLSSCRQATLIGAGASGPVRVSADGRWIGYGAAVVASSDSDEVQRPLGTRIFRDASLATWAWSPRGERLAGITTDGGVVAGAPGRQPVTLEPSGFGASQLVFDGPDAVIVVRDLNALWRIPLDGSRPRLIGSDPSRQATFTLAGVFGGEVVLWRQPFESASVAADGVPLLRVSLRGGGAHLIARSVLLGFVARCGPGLVAAVGGDRYATAGKRIVVFSRSWKATRVGTGVTPSCSADGRTVAYADADFERDGPFGEERRRIYVARVGAPARALTRFPATGAGAYAPILSADGHVVIWVQSESERLDGDEGPVSQGALRAALTTGAAHVTGPIADLGAATDYYGTWSWPQTIAATP